jgi:hypothetical protein
MYPTTYTLNRLEETLQQVVTVFRENDDSNSVI